MAGAGSTEHGPERAVSTGALHIQEAAAQAKDPDPGVSVLTRRASAVLCECSSAEQALGRGGRRGL